MLRKVLLIYCVMAAVVSVKINEDRIDDLRKRIEDMKNHSLGDEAETRSEALKKVLGKIMLNKGSLKADIIEDEFLCATCVTVIEDFLSMRRVEKLSKEDIEMLAIEMCVRYKAKRFAGESLNSTLQASFTLSTIDPDCQPTLFVNFYSTMAIADIHSTTTILSSQ